MVVIVPPVRASLALRRKTRHVTSHSRCAIEPKDVGSIPAAAADFEIEVKNENIRVEISAHIIDPRVAKINPELSLQPASQPR